MSDLDWTAIALAIVFCTGLALQVLLLKGPPRFSLPTLLIAMTLIAVGFGLTVVLAR